MDVRFLPIGDTALSVEFGNKISEQINLKVNSLNQAMKAYPIDGVTETLPTFRSLMVHYRPDVVRYATLIDAINARFEQMERVTAGRQEVLEIPVLYGGRVGEDIEEVAAHQKVTVEELIKIHSSYEYLIYMLGFTPGMAYSGAEDSLITMPRRPSPRVKVEEGAVIIQLNQTIIQPIDSPTGWNLIGHTPVKIFDPGWEDPFFLKAGQWLKFVPVTEEEYNGIKQKIADGSYEVRRRERRSKL